MGVSRVFWDTNLFITNDDRLSRSTVPGIQFIVSLERAFL